MAADPDRTPVAQDVFTYCTREKTETWHVVRNHDAKGIVERVVCKACGSEHRYRRATVAATTKSGPTRTLVRSASGATRSSGVSAASSQALDETWFQGIKKWGEKPVKTFDPTVHFTNGEVFEHTVFGKGVVQSRRENKIDVLFKSGLKTLPSKS